MLDLTHVTLAERFKARGFATVGFYANFNVAGSLGFDQGFDRYESTPINAGVAKQKVISNAEAVSDRALRWLRSERDEEQPFFMFLLYVDPHDPYLFHREFEFGEADARKKTIGSRRSLKLMESEGESGVRARKRRLIGDLYDGEIRYADHHIGRFLDALEEHGLVDDTVVIFTSDHGESLWDHRNYRGHGSYGYQHQIWVPLVVRWPGLTQPGLRVPGQVSTMDVFGSLLDGFELDHAAPVQAGSVFLCAHADRA